MGWTTNQEKVIAVRDKNVLVSAAAGSGKTATMVERIITKITDKDNPIDIDSLLVVTFTREAAASMRAKITKEIDKRLKENPLDAHLARQLMLVNKADISTIDGFCNKLVKEHFDELGIDSGFSIGDEGMLNLLKQEVMEELFNEEYKALYETLEDDEQGVFARLLDAFCDDSRGDEQLKEEILCIYEKASHQPDPERWLKRCSESLMVYTAEDVDRLEWVKRLTDIQKSSLKDVKKNIERGRRIIGGDTAPCPFPLFEICDNDDEYVDEILEANTYEELLCANKKRKPSKRPLAKKEYKDIAFDEEKIELFNKNRDSYWEDIKAYQYIRSFGVEDILLCYESYRFYINGLIELTGRFMEKLDIEKKKRRLFDFSDISHFAFRLICTYDENGNVIPTEAAKQIAEKYEEIYIDEYQDSNYIQEYILSSLSKEFKGIHNMFMVGDIKQSIYRFRDARPEIFLGKYNSYKKGDSSANVVIELNKNFRSRAIVLDTVNFFFYRLMGEDFGGITYDDDAALYPGKEYPEYNSAPYSETYSEDDSAKAAGSDGTICDMGDKTELLVIEKGESELMDDELEAILIAKRIKELVCGENPFMVYDDKLGAYRKAEYGDIAILAGSTKQFGEEIYRVLNSEKIPVYLEENDGYFEAVELETMTAMLEVIDNCYRDIPLASVLLSPIAGLDENDMSVICNYGDNVLGRKASLFDKCECYLEEENTKKDEAIKEKLSAFINMLNVFIEEKSSVSVSELVLRVLEETGYYRYAMALPGGDRRKANLDMLVDMARGFEDGYYKGLFQFVKYIEKVKIVGAKKGEANVSSEQDKTVKVMTMHKSKGLEFPIVFVARLGHSNTFNDTTHMVSTDSDFYLTTKYLIEAQRVKVDSAIQKGIKIINNSEEMAEKLRLLYVAMTRAQDKLILVGVESDSLAGYLSGVYEALEEDKEKSLLSYAIRSSKRGFLVWLECALYNQKYSKLERRVYDAAELEGELVLSATDTVVNIRSIEERAPEHESEYYSEQKESFYYEYPHKLASKLIGAKMSITQIKQKLGGESFPIDLESDEFGHDNVSDDVLYESADRVAYREIDESSGDATEGTIDGATRGTIVHGFMERLAFKNIYEDLDEDAYRKYSYKRMCELIEEGSMDKAAEAVINHKKVAKFLKSSLGQRMIAADKTDKLYREQQFSIGMSLLEIAKDFYADECTEVFDDDDIVIIQGIIDAFFYEGDEIVLMDYKTDKKTPKELVERYKVQLDYYAKTLEQLTSCKVKEKLIYSFYNDEIIPV